MNNKIIMRSGVKIDLLNIKPEQIRLSDIVYNLARINRFNGRGRRIFTVAEHLLFCTEIAEELNLSPYLKLRVLAHDFSEAYTGDILPQLKPYGFKEIEEQIEKAINLYFGFDRAMKLSQRDKAKIKEIDLLALKYEAKYLDIKLSEELDNLKKIKSRPQHRSIETAQCELLLKFAELSKAAFSAAPHAPYLIVKEGENEIY